MTTSKFYLLFEALNEKEIKSFEIFFKKNYPHRKKEIGLLSYIKKYHLSNEKIKMDKDTVIKKWLKEKSTPQLRKRIDNILSSLYQNLEDFLLWKKMQDRPIATEFQLLEIFKERQMDDLYFRKIEVLENKLLKMSDESLNNHIHLMQLYHNTFFHTNYSKIKTGTELLEKSMEHLDSFFSLKKAELAIEMLNRQIILQEKYNIPFLTEVMDFLQQKKENSISLQIIFFLQHHTKEHFEILKNQFYNTFKNLSVSDQSNTITTLLNFTSKQIRAGHLDAYDQAFELFKFGLEHKIFISEDGYLPITKFINITAVGCHLKEYDWVLNFIKRWSTFLDKKQKDNAVYMATSYIYCDQKRYEEVISLSHSVNFGDDYISLRIKGIVLCSLYELHHKNAPDLIQDYCNSFSIYLTRNKIVHSSILESFKTLIDFVRLMLRKKITYQQLQNKLSSTNNMVSKSWVLEKIKGFKEA